MVRWWCGLALVALLPSAPAGAQEPAAPAAGARIRVEYRCRLAPELAVGCRPDRYPRREAGPLLALDADTLRLWREAGAGTLAVPLGSVTRVWVADGKRRHFWPGALIGLLTGAVAGSLVGAQHEVCMISCEPATSLGMTVGAVGGFLVGGLIGHAIPGDRWREVDLAGWRAVVGPALGP